MLLLGSVTFVSTVFVRVFGGGCCWFGPTAGVLRKSDRVSTTSSRSRSPSLIWGVMSREIPASYGLKFTDVWTSVF